MKTEYDDRQVGDEAHEIVELFRHSYILEKTFAERSREIRVLSEQHIAEELFEIRRALVSALAFILYCKSGIPGITSPSIHQRLTLISTFSQGFIITESLILEGNYIKAAAILKQDFEGMTRLIALRESKKVKRGKLVSIQSVFRGKQGELYGDLNDIAHVSKDDVLVSLLDTILNNDVVGISPLPSFNAAISLQMYSSYLTILHNIVVEGILVFSEMYPASREEVTKASWAVVNARIMMESSNSFVSESEHVPDGE
jgi:hypothetical protein